MTKSFFGVMAAVFSGVSATYVLSTSSVRADMICENSAATRGELIRHDYLCGLILGCCDEISTIWGPLKVRHLHVELVRLSVVQYVASLPHLAIHVQLYRRGKLYYLCVVL